MLKITIMAPGYLKNCLISMELACPTQAGIKGLRQTPSIKEFSWRSPGKEPFLPRLLELEHHAIPGEIRGYPFGLLKGSEDLALPTGLRSQWGRVRDKTPPPPYMHLPTFVNFKALLVFLFIVLMFHMAVFIDCKPPRVASRRDGQHVSSIIK